MSWQDKAKQIVDSGVWPENVTPADLQAVESLANGFGDEPYYTVKIVVESIIGGYYKPVRP